MNNRPQLRSSVSDMEEWKNSRQSWSADKRILVEINSMNDASEKWSRMVAERHRRTNPEKRLRIASQMFDIARAIVESSLPADLSRQQRRLALRARLYGYQLPMAAKRAFAEYE